MFRRKINTLVQHMHTPVSVGGTVKSLNNESIGTAVFIQRFSLFRGIYKYKILNMQWFIGIILLGEFIIRGSTACTQHLKHIRVRKQETALKCCGRGEYPLQAGAVVTTR